MATDFQDFFKDKYSITTTKWEIMKLLDGIELYKDDDKLLFTF